MSVQLLPADYDLRFQEAVRNNSIWCDHSGSWQQIGKGFALAHG